MANAKITQNRKEVTDRIIQAMHSAGTNWNRTWQTVDMPYNAVTNAHYRGGNMIRLWLAAEDRNYQDPRWCTFLQASKQGWKIKKGERGVPCEYWNHKKEEVENKETGEIEIKEKLIGNLFYLFNVEQMEGVEPLPTAERHFNADYSKLADDLITSSECAVVEDKNSNSAYYMPVQDKIVMPCREQFYETEGFVSTLIHEMAHSTGHPDRLNRPFVAQYIKGQDEVKSEDPNQIENRPTEELVAEIASVITANELGVVIENKVMENHAKYINNWIERIKDDPNVFFRALSAAEMATDRLVENYNQVVEKEKVKVEYFVPDQSFGQYCEKYGIEQPSSEDLKEIYDALNNPSQTVNPQIYYKLEYVQKEWKNYVKSIDKGEILGKTEEMEILTQYEGKIHHFIAENLKVGNYNTVSGLYNIIDNKEYAVTDETRGHMILRCSYEDLKAAGSDKEKAMEIYQYSGGWINLDMIPMLHQAVQKRPDMDLNTYIDLAVSRDPQIITDYINKGTYDLTDAQQEVSKWIINPIAGEEILEIKDQETQSVSDAAEEYAESLENHPYEVDEEEFEV